MKSSEKELITIAAIIVGAVAVYKISGGVASAISSVGTGISASFQGAGKGLENAGAGIEYLGQGAGQGISYAGQGVMLLGAGAGAGVANVGAGIYEIGAGVGGGLFSIGSGAGYAISGLNVQDIVQTILRVQSEASTYNPNKLTQDTAQSQGQYNGAEQFAKSQASIDTTSNIPAGQMEVVAGSGVYIPVASSQSYVNAVAANVAAGRANPTTTGTISAAPTPTTPTLVSIITGGKGITTPPLVQVVQNVFSRIFGKR